VVVLRVLADRVEPAMALLRRVRSAWRALAWQLQSNPPRLWQT
jgi:urease accessory protein